MNSHFQKMIPKSMLFLSMLLFFYTQLSFSQQFIPRRSHAITQTTTLQNNVPDTLTLVGVRVEFQKDNNRLTTGNGTFDRDNLSYLDDPTITIDPLPHNLAYFENHLQFAKNYFEKVSGKQLIVKYRMVPEIHRLPKQMEAYSPTGENFTNEKLASLTQDTWAKVEQKGGFSTSGLNPNKTAFIIFHAGVGRDIELIGTTLDKTPQDIPSLFLGKSELSNLLDDPNFDGFDINGGNFKVTNSLVLPRTLSRPGEDLAGDQFTLQLSINGLLCASIGSYLGLPDLFNTQTGDSGIGRFGLMDGESFFSYRGLFPPEPSAWEKIFLGWQSPFRINTTNNAPISLPAGSFHQSNSIARYNLSNSEYFLIENRHRNPSGNGVTLTFQKNDGTTATRRYTNRDEAFVNQTNEFSETLERGVVTDVSNFDWSLPGGLDPGTDKSTGTPDDRLLNGGMLIWHIDEAVIRQEINAQSVNNNPDRRGIDLEEADGAQDIGRAASSTFDRQARGTAFDFWWKGNNASVITLDNDTLSFYQNRFGPDTRPANGSNSGAQSFFELYDFSKNTPTSSFRIRPYSGEDITPISLPGNALPDISTFTDNTDHYFSAYPLGLTLFSTAADSFLVIPSQQSTYALNLGESTNPLFNFQMGQIQQPYLGDLLILGTAPKTSQTTVTAWQWNGTNWNASWTVHPNANDAFISSVNDQILLPDFTDQQISISSGSFASDLPTAQQRSATLNGQFARLTPDKITLFPDDNSQPLPYSGTRMYTGAVPLTDKKPAFYYLTDRALLLYEPQQFNQPQKIVQNSPIEWPAMTDLNKDGRTDFIFINKRTHEIEARNINGAMLPNYPIEPPDGAQFVGTPLITTSNQSDKQRLLFVITQDSLSMNILGYHADGKPLDGFPLYVGDVSQKGNQPVHPIIHNKTLYAVSHRGELKAWEVDKIGKVLWGSRYGNASYNKISGTLPLLNTQEPTEADQILMSRETYNWPNPADDYTHLRFQTKNAGTVDIKIITSAGNVVFTQQYQTNGTVPEEHRISTEDWNNGLYFGKITARVDGEKAHKLIKIVIVH